MRERENQLESLNFHENGRSSHACQCHLIQKTYQPYYRRLFYEYGPKFDACYFHLGHWNGGWVPYNNAMGQCRIETCLWMAMNYGDLIILIDIYLFGFHSFLVWFFINEKPMLKRYTCTGELHFERVWKTLRCGSAGLLLLSLSPCKLFAATRFSCP